MRWVSFCLKQSQIYSQGISKSPEMAVFFNLSFSKTMCKIHFCPPKNIYRHKNLKDTFNLLNSLEVLILNIVFLVDEKRLYVHEMEFVPMVTGILTKQFMQHTE